MYLLMTVFAFWDGQDAHQPQTGAAKQSDVSKQTGLWPALKTFAL